MLVLLGKTCSGKNRIQKELIKLGLNAIVPYTTRPMRNGENDGVEYKFITKDKFEEMKKNNLFSATYSTYVATGDIWKYGIAKEDLKNDGVVILNPTMFKHLKKENINMKTFFLNVKNPIILDRLKKRNEPKKEKMRRLLQDTVDFRNIVHDVDFVVNNNGQRNPKDVAMTIKYFYEK